MAQAQPTFPGYFVSTPAGYAVVRFVATRYAQWLQYYRGFGWGPIVCDRLSTWWGVPRIWGARRSVPLDLRGGLHFKECS